MKRLLLCGLTFFALSCGGGPTGPTGNSVVDVAGVWSYTTRITNTSGDSCGLFNPAGGEQGSLSITQTGANLTATARSTSTGLGCEFNGTAGSNAVALGWTSCDAAIYTALTCSTGSPVTLRLNANSINATVSGRNATGSNGQTWNMTTTSNGASRGIVVVTFAFTAVR